MEVSDIINDSIKYPLNDYKKFLIIGLPFIIETILFVFLVLQAYQVSELNYINNEATGTLVISTVIFLITGIIAIFIIHGIGLSVIRETIKGNNSLPNIEVKKNFVEGMKSFVLSLIYIGIPVMVFSLISVASLLVLKENAGIIIFILLLVLLIVMILISIIYPVALSRLAETMSISESVKFKEIYAIAKNIGIVKIFVVLLICNVISSIVFLIGTFIIEIPILGLLIYTYILYNYVLLVTFRSYGLLYRDRFIYDQKPTNNLEHNIKQINEETLNSNTNHPYDFHTNTDNNNVNDSTDNFIICERCGYSNRTESNNCINCGNKLK